MLKICVERYCELTNKKVEHLYTDSHPYLDDHQFNEEELESVGELSKVYSQIVFRSHFGSRAISVQVNIYGSISPRVSQFLVGFLFLVSTHCCF